jgi:hypothetical protein
MNHASKSARKQFPKEAKEISNELPDQSEEAL